MLLTRHHSKPTPEHRPTPTHLEQRDELAEQGAAAPEEEAAERPNVAGQARLVHEEGDGGPVDQGALPPELRRERPFL